MTEQEKQNAAEAKAAERTALIVDVDDYQLNVAKVLDLHVDDLKVMAVNAFASVLRGKIESVTTKIIKEKYKAESKGKKDLAAVYEAEIQKLIALKRTIS